MGGGTERSLIAMENWIRRISAILVALTMLLGCALAEGTEAAVVADLTETEPAEETAAEETAEEEPVLLVSVNGDEIWSNNEDMQGLVDYYTSYYTSQGYSADDPDMLTALKAAGMQWAIESALYHQKAAELGTEEMTEEQKAEYEAQAREEWENAVTQYATYMGGATEESTEEEKAAARLQALSYLESNYGYTEESYVEEFVTSSRETAMRRNVQKAVLGEFEVTEDEIKAYFDGQVESDRQQFEGNVPMYEYYTKYMGAESKYVPEGYRGITHILLKVDENLMKTYQELSARLEEQQEAEEQTQPAGEELTGDAAEETAEAPAEEATEAPAEETAEAPAAEEATEAPTEEPKEPVTQEQVDAAKQAILDSVKDQVEEIMAKYQAGTSFEDLIKEYGNDPGMEIEENLKNGYAVHQESILWDPAFTAGAMALEKVGDVSEPVLGTNGIHLLHYTRDIPAGPVEMTPEMHDRMKEELISDKESEAVSKMVGEWMDAAEIVYTDEGQAIMDAAQAQQAESVETTEATEETLAGDQ